MCSFVCFNNDLCTHKEPTSDCADVLNMKLEAASPLGLSLYKLQLAAAWTLTSDLISSPDTKKCRPAFNQRRGKHGRVVFFSANIVIQLNL